MHAEPLGLRRTQVGNLCSGMLYHVIDRVVPGVANDHMITAPSKHHEQHIQQHSITLQKT